MNDKPLFSILTATCDCERYVKQCIRSVLTQTYRHIEMIIVDDCSIDRTYDIVDRFSRKYPSIKSTQNNKKLYCGKTYNKALQMATGFYCGVLDGDDVLDSRAVSTIVDYYERFQNIDFIWTKHKWCNEDMTICRDGISKPPSMPTIFESEDEFKHTYSHWRTFKTSMRDKGTLFRDLPCTVDKDLGYNLEELGRGAFAPVSLYHYRYYKRNMSHNSRQKAMWQKVRKHHAGRQRFGVVILK